MVSCTFPLHFSIITIFFTSITLSSSKGYDEQYEMCSSLMSCGNVSNIGYPFLWSGRPTYCGHSWLHLECPRNQSHDHPVLHISDETYHVLAIQNANGIIRVLPQTGSDLISPKDFNTVLNASPFSYSPTVTTVHLFYGSCFGPNMTPDTNYSLKCNVSHSDVTAYYLKNKSDTNISYQDIPQSCHFIDVPVLTEELDRLKEGSMTLLNVLKQGFEVDYEGELSKHCFKCENSGGMCGSSDALEFRCFCKDHPHTYDCRKSASLKLILGLGIPGGLCILIALNVGLCCCMKKFKFRSPTLLPRTISYYLTESDVASGNSLFGVPIFSYSELQEATNDFDSARELGDGGFGVVYYGKLRDGREVAVKRLYEKNYRGVGQFMNEVEILTKLRHQNLVTLYGCTSRHSRELLLVYEYIPNGTVADHLYGEQSRCGALTWDIRMKIAIQTASALSYLHASDIIHRDVKTTNILLDKNFSVKVADFGLSRLFPFDATHVSTAPQGTPGYLDPEYHKCYQVTNKSDVYSFGVVLIELISSLPAIDINRPENEINLSDYALNRIQNDELDELVDKKLGSESDFRVKRMTTLVAELAFQCLQQEKEVRPSMEEVFEALVRIEIVDYEALESEEKGRSQETLKSTLMMGEKDIDHQPLSNTQHPPSPNSVIESWVSRSSASNPSS